jgi:hypothetical protein
VATTLQKEFNMVHVALATPHGGFVQPEFYRQLYEMQGGWQQHQFSVAEIDMFIIGKARNELVRTLMAQTPQPEVIWFVDNDVLVPREAGVLIEQAMDLGVVSGLYVNRRFPFTPQVYKKASNARGMYMPWIDVPEKGLHIADAVGAGCLLVRTDVFDKLDEYWTPIFVQAAESLPAGSWPRRILRRLSPWFEFLDAKGEDMYFCERLEGINQTVWINVEVQCLHIGHIGVGMQNFISLKEANVIQPMDDVVIEDPDEAVPV